MKVFIVMVADRHTDPEAHLFGSYKRAKRFFDVYLDGCGDWQNYVPEDEQTMPQERLNAAGWLAYTKYAEGSSLWILEKEVGG